MSFTANVSLGYKYEGLSYFLFLYGHSLGTVRPRLIPKAVSSRIPGHKPSLNGPCPLEDESTRPAKAGGYNSRFHPGPPNSFPFIGSPSAAYTSLRFAGVAQRTPPTRPGSVRATQSGVTNIAHSRSRNSATLRWLGQEGITWGRALRFGGWDAHCRVARPRRRSASGEKGNFSFFSSC